MTELQDQYRVLEVSDDVSLATLKQAYKDLVLVWHPDRFSDHPRLQKKAEEKLKCINLAYQAISAVHRGKQQPETASEQDTARTHPSRHAQTTQQNRSQRSTRDARQHARTDPRQTQQHRSKTSYGHASGISVPQAQFVIRHFQFRASQHTSCTCLHYRSGPFKLDLNRIEGWISLANLCDSINGFHPILLAIPCKASRLFVGREAQDLIQLFEQEQQL